MLKKILKYTFRTLLVILLVLMLVPALLYIPVVQDFVRGKAVGYASRTLGMDLSVERLRLSFPLRLSVDNTLLTDKGDTLLSCGHLSLDVAVCAPAPQRGRRAESRTGKTRGALQRFHGRHGPEGRRRTVRRE